MHLGRVAEAIPALRSEAAERPWDPWVRWRLARAYNLMEMPDSACVHALEAWRMEPGEEIFLAEYFKALRRCGREPEVLELAGLVRNGGAARYHAAACGHEPSLRYLRDSSMSSDDSTAADACCWLSLLEGAGGAGERSLQLMRRCVDLAPEEGFYRSMLVEDLCGTGLLDEARADLLVLRRSRWFEPGYWDACASVAELEGDQERRLWALRRSVEAMRTPGSIRSLGWGLISAARSDMRNGRLELATQRLSEAVRLGGSSEEFVRVSDSLLTMTGLYE